MNSITNGVTFTVGQHVHYYGVPCVIRAIQQAPKCVAMIYVDFTDDNIQRLSAFDRWMLNEQAAKHHGKPDFCRPRDHGASMGCFDEAGP